MAETHLVEIPSKPADTYPVLVGANSIESLSEVVNIDDYSKIFILTDKNLETLWLSKVKEIIPEGHSIVVETGEQSKNLNVLESIWTELSQKGADRKSILLNLGGGVIGDMGGFAAATYMRGIDFVQIPTTLLAQVDASVGGKLAIDFAGGKNLIGTFAQPKAVIADTETLSTLPEAQLLSGYAEVLKHGLIADEAYWNVCSKLNPAKLSSSEMASVVMGSVKIKATVVSKDEYEGGIRKILNFGHTLGHAVESISLEKQQENFLLHGEAVAIGMAAAAQLSCRLGMISNVELDEITQSISNIGLPTKLQSQWDIEEIIARMQLDKKTVAGELNWTLLSSIGIAVFDQKVGEPLIIDVLQSLIN